MIKLVRYFSFLRVVTFGTLLCGLLCASAVASVVDSWSRTVLRQGEMLTDLNGFPVLDGYGDPQPLFPADYQPSAAVSSAGINVLGFSTSSTSVPAEVDGDGIPILDQYFQLDHVVLGTNDWSPEDTYTDLLTEVVDPRFVSRIDDTVSAYFWRGSSVYIDTFESPAPSRLTLPIPAEKGKVAIDANGGVHILVINHEYELWHYYYSLGILDSVKLSDGPVCGVAVAAGEADACHVAYTTFSEDFNLNEVLDVEDGEDVNGNSLLDVAPQQLVYQLIDGNVPDVAETVVGNTLIRVCYLDLLFSQTYGLKLAYADPVTNAIRLAERAASAWAIGQVSSTSGAYGPLALAIKSNGDCVVSFVSQSGLNLRLTEESADSWTETLIRESLVGAYFTGTDVVVRANGDSVVLAAEKNVGACLAAYTKSALPTLLPTQVQPVSIRSAFIVTWPIPGADVTQQILQASGDLSDPDSWQDLEDQNWNSWEARIARETVVEHEAQKFYRVLEISE